MNGLGMNFREGVCKGVRKEPSYRDALASKYVHGIFMECLFYTLLISDIYLNNLPQLPLRTESFPFRPRHKLSKMCHISKYTCRVIYFSSLCLATYVIIQHINFIPLQN